MLFLTMFKTLEGKVIVVELKNDLQIRGTLSSVDQYLNIKLSDITVVNAAAFPQLVRGPRHALAVPQPALACVC